jgi:hypothetical protein
MSSSTTKTTTSLEELRVAQAELCSGDTGGRVYTQVSKGAVLLLTDRTLALQQVSRKIRQELLAEIEEDKNKSQSL